MIAEAAYKSQSEVAGGLSLIDQVQCIITWCLC